MSDQTFSPNPRKQGRSHHQHKFCAEFLPCSGLETDDKREWGTVEILGIFALNYKQNQDMA